MVLRAWRGVGYRSLAGGDRAQVCEYGKHATVIVGGLVELELVEDVLDVRFDSFWAEVEVVADALV